MITACYVSSASCVMFMAFCLIHIIWLLVTKMRFSYFRSHLSKRNLTFQFVKQSQRSAPSRATYIHTYLLVFVYLELTKAQRETGCMTMIGPAVSFMSRRCSIRSICPLWPVLLVVILHKLKSCFVLLHVTLAPTDKGHGDRDAADGAAC